MTASTYTADAEPELEARIEQQLSSIRERLLAELPQQRLDALVLGGGYGRGEGGVLRTAQGPRPYNDYDLVLVHHCPPGRLLPVLEQVHREFSAQFGVHVDVTPLQRRRLSRLPRALTWYELAQGHRVLWGDPAVLSPLLSRGLGDIDPEEWGRLLFNRGAGLLLAAWQHQGIARQRFADEDPLAFSTRQLAKAWLALGDVWLADRGLYHHHVRRRRERWLAQHERPAWSEAYLDAVEFKLHPQWSWPAARIAGDLNRLRELYVEALSDRPAAPQRRVTGLYSTLRSVRPSRWLSQRPWVYPRERLKRALVAELSGRPQLRRAWVGEPGDFIDLLWRYG